MDIADLIGPIEHTRIRWTKDQLRRARGWLVYIAWGDDGKALYVGMSSVGLHRPLNPQHHQAGSFNSAASVEFICCANANECHALEKKLIYRLNPSGNKAGKRRPKNRKSGDAPSPEMSQSHRSAASIQAEFDARTARNQEKIRKYNERQKAKAELRYSRMKILPTDHYSGQ